MSDFTKVSPMPEYTNPRNLILETDSYKVGHHMMYPEGTEYVYSYLEARKGAAHESTVFFGLQGIIEEFLVPGVEWNDISEASKLLSNHIGSLMNYRGWTDLMDKYHGKIPVRIKAVPEGTRVPVGNVLMTVENTDPAFPWITNYIESLLLHVWYPTTVATRSRDVKDTLIEYLRATSTLSDEDITGKVAFMLHDFGYRGASSHDTARVGGAAHLVNFLGTDTLPAMQYAHTHYGASYADLAFSVPATEHSVMTAQGEDGEKRVVERMLDQFPDGILSVVNDSYDYQRHVTWLCTDFKERILARDGIFVTRPDSVPPGQTPAKVVVWIAKELWKAFGGDTNSKGFKVLNPKIRILWGDGIDPEGIREILKALVANSFSVECMACFGMGGGLLQKVNRDTERFSIKSSAQKRNGEWFDISKAAYGKVSKAGKLQLSVDCNGKFETLPLGSHHDHLVETDVLRTVFENGKLVNRQNFADIRERSNS